MDKPPSFWKRLYWWGRLVLELAVTHPFRHRYVRERWERDRAKAFGEHWSDGDPW